MDRWYLRHDPVKTGGGYLPVRDVAKTIVPAMSGIKARTSRPRALAGQPRFNLVQILAVSHQVVVGRLHEVPAAVVDRARIALP